MRDNTPYGVSPRSKVGSNNENPGPNEPRNETDMQRGLSSQERMFNKQIMIDGRREDDYWETGDY